MNSRDISLEALLLLIAFAKEEAKRLQLDDVTQLLELPELAVLKTITGFKEDEIGDITTMAAALSEVLEKAH